MTYSTTYYLLPRCHYPDTSEHTDGVIPSVHLLPVTPICTSVHVEEPEKSNPRDSHMICFVFLMRF